MSENNSNTLPEIRHTLLMNAPIQKVWDAVSSSEGIAAWFMPNDFQPELGYEFTLHSPYGDSPCKVTDLEPPHLLAFTWGDEWHVTFALKPAGEKTEFTLIHSGWEAGKLLAPAGMESSVVRSRMDHGWSTGILPRLQQQVEA